MYVMLCGSPPFRGRDNQELFVNICRHARTNHLPLFLSLSFSLSLSLSLSLSSLSLSIPYELHSSLLSPSRCLSRGHYSLSSKAWANVSKQAKDFIKRLLIVDPNGRYSAEDALNDPWIQGVTERGEEVGIHDKGSVSGEVYGNLNPQEAMREFMYENEEAVKDYR
jgi:serine/threonine protein kinase